MSPARVLSGAAALACVLVLGACVQEAPAIEPIAVDAGDARGETVEVALDQELYINTRELDAGVESFTAEIADDSVVEFLRGRDAGDFALYPGFRPLTVGSTLVTLTSDDEDVPPLDFTIEVTPG